MPSSVHSRALAAGATAYPVVGGARAARTGRLASAPPCVTSPPSRPPFGGRRGEVVALLYQLVDRFVDGGVVGVGRERAAEVQTASSASRSFIAALTRSRVVQPLGGVLCVPLDLGRLDRFADRAFLLGLRLDAVTLELLRAARRSAAAPRGASRRCLAASRRSRSRSSSPSPPSAGASGSGGVGSSGGRGSASTLLRGFVALYERRRAALIGAVAAEVRRVAGGVLGAHAPLRSCPARGRALRPTSTRSCWPASTASAAAAVGLLRHHAPCSSAKTGATPHRSRAWNGTVSARR